MTNTQPSIGRRGPCRCALGSLAFVLGLSLPLHGRPVAHAQSAAVRTVEQTLDLVVGENRMISAEDVASYSEGAEGIVTVKITPDGKRFVLVGRTPGTTTLMLIKKDGTQLNHELNVLARSPRAVKRELEELLDATLGVTVRRVGARYILEGQVHTEAQLARVERITTLFDGQVKSLVTVGAATGSRQVNIRFDLFFVQYDRRNGLQVGLDFPGRVTANSSLNFNLQTASLASATSVLDLPFPALDLASGTGYTKLLRHASVITTNGVTADFSNGGEQNFRTASGVTSNVQAIAFGTKMSVLPNYDPRSQEVEVKVVADVSELVAAASGDLPGRTTTNLSTIVKMRPGQALVLSGIRSLSARSTTRGIPFLSQIPILGALFGSQGEEEEELEGAIFIIPSTVDNLSTNASDAVRRALRDFEHYEGDLDELKLSSYSPPPWEAQDKRVASELRSMFVPAASTPSVTTTSLQATTSKATTAAAGSPAGE